jgi:hypothetical protein
MTGLNRRVKGEMMLTYIPDNFAALAQTKLGRDIWKFLNEEATIAAMKTATDLGRTAVEGFEEKLLERFEDDVEVLLEDRTKQMIGHMTKQVMTAAGYVIDQQNVKIPSGVFSRATRYKRTGAFTYYAHLGKGDGRDVALTADRAGAALPSDEKWVFWKSFEGGLRARIGFGLEDEVAAQKAIREKGYYLHHIKRLMRPA